MSDYEWDMFLHTTAHWWFTHYSVVAEHTQDYIREMEARR